jgi:hypothetical protein
MTERKQLSEKKRSTQRAPVECAQGEVTRICSVLTYVEYILHPNEPMEAERQRKAQYREYK